MEKKYLEILNKAFADEMDVKHVDSASASETRIKNALIKIPNFLRTHVEHSCSHDECTPLNENALIEMNILTKPVLDRDVYVCKYMVTHVCHANSCDQSVRGVCPISGLCHGNVYSQYDPLNSKTWYIKDNEVNTKPINARAGLSRKKTNKKRVENVKALITKLLSPNMYEKVHNTKRNLYNEQCLKRQQRYIKKCVQKNISVNLISLMMMQDVSRSKQPELCTQVYDSGLIQMYTDKVMSIIERAQKLNITCKYQHAVLGVLYTACEHFVTIDQTKPIAFDKHLMQLLPTQHDLKNYYNLKKPDITSGMKLVQKICNDQVKK